MRSPRHVPLDGGPWRLSMGLRRLELDEWLEVDEHRAEELAYKRVLLERSRDDVAVALEGSQAACEEVRDLVVEAASALLGERLEPDPSRPALEAAALLVQEDLCVLERVDGPWRLTAACVCFPSRWDLKDKLGASLLEIHGPVPRFERDLGRQATTFFDRLSVERPVWRCNWTVLETPELHLPSPAARAGDEAPLDPGALWFRVERQTLRRLARTGAVVFTIRTYVTALAELVAADPGAAASLRDTLVTVDDDVAAYKGWGTLLAPTVAWLERAGREGDPRS